jgi:type II secretory pathway component PulF
MVEQMNAQENEQSKVQKFFNSPAGLILFGTVAVIGLVCSGLGALDAIEKYKYQLIICGFIAFPIGIYFVVKYAIKAYKENMRWKSQVTLLGEKMNNIETLLRESKSLIDLATKGMEITGDFVTIDFDAKKQLYYFDFEKRFKVT